jgi:hypothetical protein
MKGKSADGTRAVPVTSIVTSSEPVMASKEAARTPSTISRRKVKSVKASAPKRRAPVRKLPARKKPAPKLDPLAKVESRLRKMGCWKDGDSVKIWLDRLSEETRSSIQLQSYLWKEYAIENQLPGYETAARNRQKALRKNRSHKPSNHAKIVAFQSSGGVVKKNDNAGQGLPRPPPVISRTWRRRRRRKCQRIKQRKFRARQQKKRHKDSLAPSRIPMARIPLAQGPLLFRRGRMKQLLHNRRRKLKETLAGISEAFRLQVVDGELTLSLDESPRAGAKSFWKNARLLGYRRRRRVPYKGLFFLALLITTSGINQAVARQLDHLFGYLADGKPHGFLKNAKVATRLCLVLSN